MSKASQRLPEYAVVELEGTRYAMLREELLLGICQLAGVSLPEQSASSPLAEPLLADEGLDPGTLASKLIARRRQAGLSQAQTARLAGIRVETLNRIERGKSTPDFRTIRKLVSAINASETEARNETLARLTEHKE